MRFLVQAGVFAVLRSGHNLWARIPGKAHIMNATRIKTWQIALDLGKASPDAFWEETGDLPPSLTRRIGTNPHGLSTGMS